MEGSVSDYLDFLNDLNDDDDLELPREQPDLDTTLKTLRENVDGAANTVIFYGLSRLDVSAIVRVQDVWNTLSAEYRHKLMQQLIDVSETNFDLDYYNLGIMALGDESPAVRADAIELLWEDETLHLMDRLIEMAQWDEAVEVRAAAAGALGRFILLGELGDLPESETVRAQDVVANLYNDQAEDIDVRRRSLEAIANCGHEMVTEAIQEAYESDDPRMQASAVFAMGRTCDNRWNEIVLKALTEADPAVRYEAARASGELEISEAVPYLARFAQGRDREIKEVSIWSLGEIGGNYAMKTLGTLADAAEKDEDVELLEAIEEALGNASFAGRDLDFDLDD